MAGRVLIPGPEYFPVCRVTQWGESWAQPQSPLSGPVGERIGRHSSCPQRALVSCQASLIEMHIKW